MRLQGGAPDLAASVDGAYVACATADKLTLYGQDTRSVLATAPLDGPADIAFIGRDRLLVVVRGDGRSQLCGYSLPSLEPVAVLELEDRLVVLAAVGERALVTDESLEQPRVVALTSKIVVDTIALREPLLLATAAPEERLLAASRTRDTQLECWDPALRRALFRLNLPLLPTARLAGFSARRRLLWIAAGGPSGTLEVFRYSDGRLQARVELGASIAGAAGHPDSPRLVVATRKSDDAPIELTELDFQAGERRELTAPAAPSAMCVVEGTRPAVVLVSDGELTWMSLAAAPAEATAAAATTVAAASAATAVATRQGHPRVADPSDWRGKLQAAKAAAAAAAAPVRAAAGGSTATATATAHAHADSARANSPRADSPRADAVRADSARGLAARTAAARVAPPPAPRAPDDDAAAPPTHWRDELCDWAERQLASRHPLEQPAPPDDSALGIVVARLALDERAARALALAYGARLLGQPDLPAATVARALAHDGETDDAAWDEALARGLLGRLGLARLRDGRLRLTTPAGRFLDGAPPRIAILTGSPSDAELPPGTVRLDGGAEAHQAIGERLAARYGYDVALVLVENPAPARMLAWKLVEARLHGAWPLVDVSAKAARWTAALDDGPTVVIVRGDEVPASIAALPSL